MRPNQTTDTSIYKQSVVSLLKRSVQSANGQISNDASAFHDSLQESRGIIHPRIYEIFETDENAMSVDLSIKKLTLIRVQKTIRRLYKIKTFYAKFGITLDVENLDLGQVGNDKSDSDEDNPK